MQAEDGAQAIAILEKHAFEAIVTDLVMPNMCGDELVAWLDAHRPELSKRVIVMSGGSDDPTRAAWLRTFDATRFVAKPATVGDLVRVIGYVIDRNAT